MGIIQFKEANCKNCYKCIRSCPVKAIAFKNEQARIVEEDCMLCGNCLKACPQNAKTVKSDIEIVKGYINKKEKVYVSLAPSFISAYESNDGKSLFSALKKLGFTHVEETAIGAMAVSRQYEKLMSEKKMKNIITTACPSINFLIEKYYPELIDQMAPVVSPMIAHAKMLRETYGQRIRIVFIGPCLSKKDECNDMQNDGVVDAVLTFEELSSWMNAEGIYINDEFSDEIKASKDMSARIYPVPGGILKTIDNKFKANYKCISIDGVDRCMKILDSMKNGEIENYFIEMNSCQGGCIGGPCMNEVKGGFLIARERLIEYVRKGSGSFNLLTDMGSKIDFRKKFINRTKKYVMPSEATIQGILNSIGKFTKDKELRSP
jgi:iron only hydrogenase large subunit-like protein